MRYSTTSIATWVNMKYSITSIAIWVNIEVIINMRYSITSIAIWVYNQVQYYEYYNMSEYWGTLLRVFKVLQYEFKLRWFSDDRASLWGWHCLSWTELLLFPTIFFVRILKCIYLNFEMYLSEFWNVFIWIFEMYLSEFWNVYIWILECICTAIICCTNAQIIYLNFETYLYS